MTFQDRHLVILVHGAVERGTGFRAVVELLPDYDVIAYDRRGHGLRWLEGTASLGEDIDELLGLIDDRVATVVGHSLGGLIVLGAALRRPELFASLGLYETAIPWSDWWSEVEREVMITEIDRSAEAMASGSSLERDRLNVAWQSCRRQVLEAFDGPFHWQDVEVPIVTGRGELSQANSARDASVVARYFHLEALILRGSDHRAHRSNPKEFADFVRACVGAKTEWS